MKSRPEDEIYTSIYFGVDSRNMSSFDGNGTYIKGILASSENPLSKDLNSKILLLSW